MTTFEAAGAAEVAWHISSYSANGSGQCVEAGPVLDASGRFAVRDSRNRGAAVLTAPRSEWAAFLDAVRAEAL